MQDEVRTWKLYIASSWRNQHAVELLTAELRRRGYEVASFVEAYRRTNEDRGPDTKLEFDEWVWSEDGRQKFEYDTEHATRADLVVYVGPSGIDAWAEVGAAWGAGRMVLGLYAKGEEAGLMRRMVEWFDDSAALVETILGLFPVAQVGKEGDRDGGTKHGRGDGGAPLPQAPGR